MMADDDTRPLRLHGAGALLAGRYRLEERVATGGMGEVWRATDLVLERRVAVKLLRETLVDDPKVAERFRREALLAASLSHPSIAGVLDYVQEDGRPGIVMEYVEGETLADRLAREGPLAPAEAVRIATALLDALGAAHEAGIVHRDVKPGNVILTRAGEVKLTDLGVARAASHTTLTDTGMVVGTAHYLSPEQATGRPATPASDLYAVGAILYEMLVGARPFEAETPLAVAMKRLAEDPRPPRELRPDLPEPLERVVLRGLARDPDRRYRSARTMREALRAAVAPGGPGTPPAGAAARPEPTLVLPAAGAATRPSEPVVPQPRAPGRRRRTAVLAAIAVAAGVVALLLAARGPAGPSLVTVPALTGRPAAEAARTAARVGLRTSLVSVPSDRPRGIVLAQDPRAGVRVEAGTTVILTASSGTPPRPPGVPVPDLRGLEEDEARRPLEAAGLRLGHTTSEESDAVDPGTVLRSDPPAGSTVEPGTAVDIVVAAEPRRGRGKGKGGD
jgi:tRNA A-37 threonylcarbamoyl transferase component Bud32